MERSDPIVHRRAKSVVWTGPREFILDVVDDTAASVPRRPQTFTLEANVGGRVITVNGCICRHRARLKSGLLRLRIAVPESRIHVAPHGGNGTTEVQDGTL